MLCILLYDDFSSTEGPGPAALLGMAMGGYPYQLCLSFFTTYKHTAKDSSPLVWGKFTFSSSAIFSKSVQPHSRGVNSSPNWSMIILVGSAPLAWGKLFFPTKKSDPVGSAPLAWGKCLEAMENYFQQRFSPTRVG